MNQWIISRMPEYPGKIIAIRMQEQKAVQITVQDEEETSLLGRIYIGKVKNIAANLAAAFVEIADGQLCYVPLSELSAASFTDPAAVARKKPCAGDEVLIQISKEALKTKLPGGTGNLTLTGTYAVLTSGKRMLGLSGKLSSARKEALKEQLSDLVTDSYGFIIRTNAQHVSEEVIRQEAATLAAAYKNIRKIAGSRTCFSCLYRPAGPLLRSIQGTGLSALTEIVTDLPSVEEEMHDFLEQNGLEERISLRRYEDLQLPLYKLYSFSSILTDALRERVWLKSGGYLVIQPTEALTVIDVNTGKYDGRKQPEETFLKINLEAAKEAARQLRLRNLSGIILIDFIDMKKQAHTAQVAEALRGCLKEDPVKADFVDFTKLGLAELTRKKEARPLAELLRKKELTIRQTDANI